jgi:hypothetical protein
MSPSLCNGFPSDIVLFSRVSRRRTPSRFALAEWTRKAQQAPVHQQKSEAKSGMPIRPGRGRLSTVRTTGRLLSILALALTLAGCDKCGGWFGLHAPFTLGVCKNTVPPQR